MILNGKVGIAGLFLAAIFVFYGICSSLISENLKNPAVASRQRVSLFYKGSRIKTDFVIIFNMSKNITFGVGNRPNFEELERLFYAAFSDGPDSGKFTPETNQVIKEWFDIKEFKNYLKYGSLIEARLKGKLVGVVFVAKQNPITWPDGKKAECFILAVLPEYRNQGIGRKLVAMQEIEAKKFGARKIIINTHVLLRANQELFKNLGYQKIGVLKDYYDNGDAIFFSKEL